MKKILHIFGTMNYGGAELRTIDIMRHVDRNNYQFDFCTLSGNDGLLDKEIKDLGGNVFKCKLKSILFPIKFLNLIKKNNYDIVHSHIHYPSGIILLLAKVSGVKVRINHFRIAYDYENPNKLRLFRDYILKIIIDAVCTSNLAVSEYTMDYAWNKNWKDDPKCEVIYNGIESKYIEDFNKDKFKLENNLPLNHTLFLHIGRMDEQKNHIRVIELFEKYYQTNSKSTLLLIGKSDTLIGEELLKRFGNQSNIIFCGIKNNIAEYINAADIMIFPSFREGLPGVVLEGLSAGLPIVCSNIGCHQEIKKYIPNLKVLDLSLSDDMWIGAIKNILSQENIRKQIINEFDKSPFHIKKNVNLIEYIYEKNISGEI